MTIQEALDRCLEDISSGSASVEECLARYPEYASDLRPLLRTAARLRKAEQVRPSRAFKSRLRNQLVSEEPRPRPGFFNLRNLITWVVIVLLILGIAVWAGIRSPVDGRTSTPPPIDYVISLNQTWI